VEQITQLATRRVIERLMFTTVKRPRSAKGLDFLSLQLEPEFLSGVIAPGWLRQPSTVASPVLGGSR
jgi:hypothetical protein